MRTNIVLDEGLVSRAKELTGLKTKKAIVDEALRCLVRQREQQSIRALRGKLRWEGDLDQMRANRVEAAR